MEHIHNGRTWRAIGRVPYTRRDGGQTELIVWRGFCRECGAAFEIRTPVAFETSKAFATVHCPEHRHRERMRDRSLAGDHRRNDTP